MSVGRRKIGENPMLFHEAVKSTLGPATGDNVLILFPCKFIFMKR